MHVSSHFFVILGNHVDMYVDISTKMPDTYIHMYSSGQKCSQCVCIAQKLCLENAIVMQNKMQLHH